MAHFKQIASQCVKALNDFEMISGKDKILIGFSGGKDSYMLIKIFEYLKRKNKKEFSIKIVTVDPGFDANFSKNIKKQLEEFEFPYEIIESTINKAIIKKSKEKKLNPCFLCSRMRRGILYNYAIENNYNKIALGHNIDDAIETHLMNLFFSSKPSTLKAKYLAENKKIEIIRPLIYVDETEIEAFTKKKEFKPTKENCPLKKEDSKREYFKKIISDLEKNNPKIKQSAKIAFKKGKSFWNIPK